MQVAGDLRLGEADSAAGAIFLRTTGMWGRLIQILGCLGPAILGATGIALIGAASDKPNSLGLIWLAVLAGVVLLPFAVGPLASHVLRTSRLARGATESTFCTFDLDDEGIRMRWEGAEHWCAWRKISEIILHRDMWVVIAEMGYCLPRRLFADREAEAAFLDQVLSQLSPEAVRRSWDATFVRGGKAIPWTGYGKA